MMMSVRVPLCGRRMNMILSQRDLQMAEILCMTRRKPHLHGSDRLQRQDHDKNEEQDSV